MSTVTPGATERKLSGTSPVRMRFTPSVPTFNADRVWLRVYRDRLTEVTLPSDLSVKLYRGATLLASATVPKERIVVTGIDQSYLEDILPRAEPVPYIPISLGVSVQIVTASEHTLVLSTTAGQYTIHAVAWDTAFQSRNTFTDGVAEFSTDSGATWQAWATAGSYAADKMVLPFLLQVASSVEPPVGVLAMMSKSVVTAAGVGVKFHTDAYETLYATLKTRLIELGVSWLRATPTADATKRGRFLDLAASGFRFLFVAGGGGHGYVVADNILAWVKALNTEGGGEGSVCIAVEPEHQADNVAGETVAEWVPRLVAQMTAIGTNYPADAAADSLYLLGPGFAKPASPTSLLASFTTAPAFFSKANLQAYHNGDHPEGANGGGAGISIPNAITRAKLGGTDPAWITAASFRVQTELPSFEA